MAETPAADEDATRYLETLDDLIRVPPFHNWLGIRVTHAEPGRAACVMPYRAELVGNPAIPSIHGGIIAGLIDLVGSLATFTVCHAPTPTIDLRVDYIRPAVEHDLVAEARVVNSGRTIAFVDVEIVQEDKLVATGRATYSTKGARPSMRPDAGPIG